METCLFVSKNLRLCSSESHMCWHEVVYVYDEKTVVVVCFGWMFSSFSGVKESWAFLVSSYFKCVSHSILSPAAAWLSVSFWKHHELVSWSEALVSIGSLRIISSLIATLVAKNMFFTLCGLWLSLFKVIRSDKCSAIIKTFKWHANSRHNNPLKSWWNRSITFRWFYHGVKRACVCVNNSCTEHSVLELTLSWHESENWKRGAPVRGNY